MLVNKALGFCMLHVAYKLLQANNTELDLWVHHHAFFSTSLTKGNNFYDFLFAFFNNKPFQNGVFS